MTNPTDDVAPVVIAAAKAVRLDPDEPTVLSTGVRAKMRPVSATLIDSVTSRILDPDVPTIYMEEKGREIPNPDDPHYVKAMNEASRQRGLAALDALVMFGVELVDPIPPMFDANRKPINWWAKLLLMQKMKQIDLGEYDMDDPLVVDFVYKRLIAVAPADIERLNRMNRVGGEELARAERSF